jgi:hypothetical protein
MPPPVDADGAGRRAAPGRGPDATPGERAADQTVNSTFL